MIQFDQIPIIGFFFPNDVIDNSERRIIIFNIIFTETIILIYALLFIRDVLFEKNKKIHKTPIIAITAHDLEFEKEKAMKLGFDYYLTKPFSKQDLFNAVQKFKT